MALIFFKYCLPALLGYTLFIGIAGRLNPLIKPHYAEERPSWALGIWTGLSVTLVLSIGLHMAYGMSLEGARSLLKPSVWFMTALMLPGLFAYFVYRHQVRKNAKEVSSDWTLAPDEFDLIRQDDIDSHLLDQTVDADALDAMDIPEPERSITTFPEPETSDTHNSALHLSDTHRPAEIPLISDTHTPSEAHPSPDTHTPADASPLSSPISDTHIPPEAVPLSDTHIPVEAPLVSATHTPVDEHSEVTPSHIHSETISEVEPLGGDSHQSLLVELNNLETQLNEEQTLREETENHLRITRKALFTLEAESRHFESSKADSVIALEEKLACSIERQSELETDARRVKDKLVKAESSTVMLKQNLIKAKQDIRRSTAARAKALSTANKSIAFARQAVQIRSQLEAELTEARATLQNRQATISSLISTLETEKRRTQEEVAAMARQMALHDKQMKARRSLEEVARNVENKLTSRLVKKVAKARPLTPNH